MSFYEITEEDIEAIVRYLKIFHPEKANREYAAAMLEYTKAGLRRMASSDPDKIEKLFEAYESSRQKKA